MKDQTNQKTKTTIVIQTLQSSFGCILAPFCEYRHLRVMGTVECTTIKHRDGTLKGLSYHVTGKLEDLIELEQ